MSTISASQHKFSWKKLIQSIKDKYTGITTRITDWWGKTYIKLPKPISAALTVIKNSVTLFRSHDTASLGSGLSYYTVFSIAPMMIIIISIAGSIFGPEAVTGELKGQMQSLLGSSTADQLQSMVKAAYKPGKNWIATTVSIALLLTGAIGVFDQLRSSLNIIWDVKPVAKKPFWTYLMNRLFSFGMIASIAFLLIVSLALNAAVAALSGYLNGLLPAISKVLIGFAEVVVSFGLTTLLFTLIYKFMSDVKMKWKNVFFGALFTSVLFAAGKYLIGIYIGNSNIANTYGAASSVIVVLLWVFYSSQIVFFGAEFTRALADYRGIKIPGTEAPPPPKP
ncbi:MAG: ribonuclease [Bacteroidetes bacterium]|nr:ribonuclease [Bacteroidota bacterium]